MVVLKQVKHVESQAVHIPLAGASLPPEGHELWHDPLKNTNGDLQAVHVDIVPTHVRHIKSHGSHTFVALLAIVTSGVQVVVQVVFPK